LRGGVDGDGGGGEEEEEGKGEGEGDATAVLSTGAGTQGALLLTLPMGEDGAEVEVDVGSLLPRLQRLASRRGDAQVKVLAGEAIHALVVFLVGTSATRLRAGAAEGAGVDKGALRVG
jgi:hypothetical protein